MPFDFLPAETRTLTLAELSRVLRNPQEWPADFEWYYGNCQSCAMGLAFRLVGERFPESGTAEHSGEAILAQQFGIPKKVANDLFYYVAWSNRIFMEEVTPIHVADAIDAYLAGEGGKEA
jgi:hypothetical protein